MATIKDTIQGLAILSKYGIGDECDVEGQHDAILVSPAISQQEVSPEDIKALDKLGWFWSKDNDCWSIFT